MKKMMMLFFVITSVMNSILSLANWRTNSHHSHSLILLIALSFDAICHKRWLFIPEVRR